MADYGRGVRRKEIRNRLDRILDKRKRIQRNIHNCENEIQELETEYLNTIERNEIYCNLYSGGINYREFDYRQWYYAVSKITRDKLSKLREEFWDTDEELQLAKKEARFFMFATRDGYDGD